MLNGTTTNVEKISFRMQEQANNQINFSFQRINNENIIENYDVRYSNDGWVTSGSAINNNNISNSSQSSDPTPTPTPSQPNSEPTHSLESNN